MLHLPGLVIILLVVLLVLSIPTWPYSRAWGPYPSGALGIIVVVLILLILLGYL